MLKVILVPLFWANSSLKLNIPNMYPFTYVLAHLFNKHSCGTYQIPGTKYIREPDGIETLIIPNTQMRKWKQSHKTLLSQGHTL